MEIGITSHRKRRKQLLGSHAFVVAAMLGIACVTSACKTVDLKELFSKDRSPNRILVYKKAGGSQQRLFLFDPSSSGDRKRRPCVVYIHGGGWGAGKPDLFFPHCHYFAKRGAIAISISYRLWSKKRGQTVFDCVADCQSAIRFIRTHADEFGIDPNRIAVAGDSAGGHLAACVGLIGDESSKANALVLYNPIVDLETGWGQRAGARKLEISPIHHIQKGAPPTLLMHGDADRVVKVDQARRFAKAMESLGNTCRYIEMPGVDHAFVVSGYGTLGQNHQAIAGMDRFLVDLGYLKGNPALAKPKDPNGKGRRL